jgi:transcription antitermination factor NusG
MFPEGQRVRVTESSFATCEGVVISYEEAVQRGFYTADNPPPADGSLLVVLTFWGRPLVVELAPNQICAI